MAEAWGAGGFAAYRLMNPLIIVCGLGRTGFNIFRLLQQQGAEVHGISDVPIEGENIVIGDPRRAETLVAAGIHRAHTLVLAGADHTLNLAILTQARVLNPRVRIIDRILDTHLGEHLDRILPDHFTLSVAALAAPIFTFAALGSRAIGQLQLFDQTWPIHEEVITPEHPWCGRRMNEFWDDKNRMLIYYLSARDPIDLVSAVIQERVLQVGDRLLIGNKPAQVRRRRPWQERLRKLWKGIQRLQHHDQPILAVTLTLLLTIFLATCTYLAVNLDTPFVDALYFSVGMITGAGGKEEVAEAAPAGIKLFTAVMMLVGAGIIGICYALLNDFILGSRLRQVWDVARAPQRGHYIICGLGGIGINIASQLQASGHEVVVIERNAECRFLSSAREQRIPVLIADASLSDTLSAAHIQQAEALIAVTSNDTVNLQVALAAKGLAPRLPVVVRNHDPDFARQVQQVFEFEAVLSPAELVAPTFAAAALGGKILGNGLVGNQLWVALGTLITRNHNFFGRQLKEVAAAVDLVPLYLERPTSRIHGWELLVTFLQEGDVLYLTIPAAQLDHLWRSASSSDTPKRDPYLVSQMEGLAEA